VAGAPTTKQKKSGYSKYRYSRIMTAGKVQTMQLLVSRAKQLIPKIDLDKDQPQSELLQCRNIVSQLEMALNFRKGYAAPAIFAQYELIYTALADPTPKSLETALFLFNHLEYTFNLLMLRRR
jgi:flagellin-specific chaperone FliS